MTLFNDDTSATSGAHYHEPAASEPEGFTMPRRRISSENITEAVRVLSAEIGRSVTAREIQQRFSMELYPSAYLKHAFDEGLIDRTPRMPTEDDRSHFAYRVRNACSDAGDAWSSSANVAQALRISERTLRLWAKQGKVERRGTGKNVQYRCAAWLSTRQAAEYLGVSRRTLQRRAKCGMVERRYRNDVAEYLVTPALVADIERRRLPAREPTAAPQSPPIVQPEPTPEPTPEPSVPTVQTRERVTLRDVLALVLAWIADLMGVNR